MLSQKAINYCATPCCVHRFIIHPLYDNVTLVGHGGVEWQDTPSWGWFNDGVNQVTRKLFNCKISCRLLQIFGKENVHVMYSWSSGYRM